MSKRFNIPSSMVMKSDYLGQKREKDGKLKGSLTFSFNPIPLFSSDLKVFKQLIKSEEWVVFNKKFAPLLNARLKMLLLDKDRIDRYKKAKDHEATPFCLSKYQLQQLNAIDTICKSSAKLRKKRGDALAYLEIVKDVDHNDKEFRKVMRSMLTAVKHFLKTRNDKLLKRHTHSNDLAGFVQLQHAVHGVLETSESIPSAYLKAYDAFYTFLNGDQHDIAKLATQLDEAVTKAEEEREGYKNFSKLVGGNQNALSIDFKCGEPIYREDDADDDEDGVDYM